MKTDLFQACGHCCIFQIWRHIEFSILVASPFRIWNSSAEIPSHPVAFFRVILSKAHLTLDSRMSGSRWVITPSWLSGSLLADKDPYSQSYGIPSSHVWMWELDHKGGWVRKNWCFPIVVLEKTLESPLHCKEIKPVNLKENQSWIFIGRTNAEAKVPILWPPNGKSHLTGKDPGAGKNWGLEEKEMVEDEMVGWHHWFNGHEFEQTLGDSGGQGNLTCCSPWGFLTVGHNWATE